MHTIRSQYQSTIALKHPEKGTVILFKDNNKIPFYLREIIVSSQFFTI